MSPAASVRPKKSKTLRAVSPNFAIELRYRGQLRKLIDAMNASVLFWIGRAFAANEPAIAQDALPASELQKEMRRLRQRWKRKVDASAPELAKWFAESVDTRSTAALKKILRDGGFTVQFAMTRAQRDIIKATINANVSLIKSIPEKYLGQVEGMVMRSVQRGGDLATLTKDIRRQYGVTQRRAELIARDQNIKATSAMNKARRVELGLFEAIWMHSHAGKKPRPTHVAMNGKKFDIRKGMYDSHEKRYVQPGELINCRCKSKPVIPGL